MSFKGRATYHRHSTGRARPDAWAASSESLLEEDSK